MDDFKRLVWWKKAGASGYIPVMYFLHDRSPDDIGIDYEHLDRKSFAFTDRRQEEAVLKERGLADGGRRRRVDLMIMESVNV